MGTRMDLLFHGASESECKQAYNLIYKRVNELEDLLSRYREDSPLSMINRLASRQPVAPGTELYGILELCREYHTRTCGIFDVAVGKVIRQIKDGSIKHETVEKNLANTGMDQILFDQENQTISFLSPEVEIDLGGFGKGFALDQVKSLLISAGISDSFISFGESSIMAHGNHPHGSGWKAGINHVFKPGESLFFFELHEESLSTSGTGQNTHGGELIPHIIHPVKGVLHQDIKHVSAAGPQAVEVEVVTTALMAAGQEEKLIIMEKFPDCRVVFVEYDRQGNPIIQDHRTE